MFLCGQTFRITFLSLSLFRFTESCERCIGACTLSLWSGVAKYLCLVFVMYYVGQLCVLCDTQAMLVELQG